jgi:WD40 repeat protein
MAYYDLKVSEIAEKRRERERKIRDWFDRFLITVQGRRGQVLQGDPSQTVPDGVVADLVDAHLVREDKRAGATWFELAHDRLIDPVRKSNAAWADLHLSSLQRMAQVWEKEGKPPANFLLRHEELKPAEEWAAGHAAEMNPLDQEYLETCCEHRARGEAKRIQQRVRIYRWVIAAALLLSGVLVGLIALTTYFYLDAEANRKVALLNARDAQDHATLADREKSVAERRKRVIQAQHEAAQLTDAARDKRRGDPELSVYLALRALARLDEAQEQAEQAGADDDGTEVLTINRARMAVRSLLNSSTQSSRVRLTLLGHSNEVNAVAYSRDGRLVATASDDGTLRFWSARTGEQLGSVALPQDRANSVAFSPADDLLAAGGVAGLVRLWRYRWTGDARGSLRVEPEGGPLPHGSEVNAVAFSPEGTRLAAGGDGGGVTLWTVPAWDDLPAWLPHDKGVNAVAFHPKDGRRLAAAGEDGKVLVWDTGSPTPLYTITRDPPVNTAPSKSAAAVKAVAFDPRGDRLATGDEDGAVVLWAADSGRLLLALNDDTGSGGTYWRGLAARPGDRFRAHIASVKTIAFSPDEKWVVTGGREGLVKVWNATTGQLELPLTGHQKIVSGAAFNPRDPKQLATSSDDYTTKVWALDPDAQPYPQAGAEPLNCVAVSADGSRVAASSWAGWAKVWDTATGAEVWNLPTGHHNVVGAVGFSPDGTRLVTGSDDNTAKVWDADSGAELHTLGPHTRPVRGAVYSRDGARVVTAGLDGLVRAWNGTTGAELHSPVKLVNLPVAPTFVVTSPNGAYLVAGEVNGTLHLWEAATGRELAAWKGHSARVNCAAFPRGGRRVVTGSSDGTAKVWDFTADGIRPTELCRLGSDVLSQFVLPPPHYAGVVTTTLRLRVPRRPVFGVAVSADATWVATGTADGVVTLWNPAEPREQWAQKFHRSAIRALAFSPDGTRLASASADGTAHVCEVTTGFEGKSLQLPGVLHPLDSVAFSPDGSRLATGHSDGTALTWDVATGSPLRSFKGIGFISAIAIAPDTGKAAVAGGAPTVFVFDRFGGRVQLDMPAALERFWLPPASPLAALGTLARRPAPAASVLALAFGPGGRLLAAGDTAGTARVWDTDTGRLVNTFRGTPDSSGAVGAVSALVFDGDGSRLAVGSQDRSVTVWAVGASCDQPLFDIPKKGAHDNGITAVAFSPDGRRLATGSLDRTVKLWDTSGTEQAAPLLHTLKGYDGPPLGLAFSADSRRLATAAGDGTITVWDAEAGKEYLSVKEADAQVFGLGYALAYKADDHVLAVDSRRAVRQYLLSLPELKGLAERRISPPGQRGHMQQWLDGFLQGK